MPNPVAGRRRRCGRRHATTYINLDVPPTHWGARDYRAVLHACTCAKWFVEGRVRVLPWLWADADLNLARGRLRDEPRGTNRIPLAPTITTAGGLTTTETRGLSAGVRWRHVGKRAATADNTVHARGYALVEAFSAMRLGGATIRVAVDNVLNVRWNEVQFATTSRLRGEAAPVTELHYTPGAPRAITVGIERRF